jgi:hypothetical protein
MNGILKLTILSTIDNLDRRMLRRVKLVYNVSSEINKRSFKNLTQRLRKKKKCKIQIILMEAGAVSKTLDCCFILQV